MPAPLTDRPAYLVVSQIGASAYVPEVNVPEMDRRIVVRDIAKRQYVAVSQVLELNVTAGTCRDVFDEVAREVMTFWADEGQPLESWQYEFVEMNISIQAARSFQRVA